MNKTYSSIEIWCVGKSAALAGKTVEDNPYKHTPNSRGGDFKRAWWISGWNAGMRDIQAEKLPK